MSAGVEASPYTKEELMARVEEAETDIAAGRYRTEEEMEAFMDGALEELKATKPKGKI